MNGEAAPRVCRTEQRGRQDEQGGQPRAEHEQAERGAGQQQRGRAETKKIEPPRALELRERRDTNLIKETTGGLRKDERVGQRCQRHGADAGATAPSARGSGGRDTLEPRRAQGDADLPVELVRLAATLEIDQVRVEVGHLVGSNPRRSHTATTDMGRTMETATHGLITRKVRMRGAVNKDVPLTRLGERLNIEPGTLLPRQRYEEKRQRRTSRRNMPGIREEECRDAH